MKRILLALLSLLLLVGCGESAPQEQQGSEAAVQEKQELALSYQQITAEEAKSMMDERGDAAVILDVRTQEEYDEAHIPNAKLLPHDAIDETSAADIIGEKDTPVLVYCRSGNRSKKGAEALAALGYSQVYEFGGIRDWPYETEQ